MYYFYEQNGNLAHHYDLNELTAGYVDEYKGITSSDVLAQNFINMVRYPENPVDTEILLIPHHNNGLKRI